MVPLSKEFLSLASFLHKFLLSHLFCAGHVLVETSAHPFVSCMLWSRLLHRWLGGSGAVIRLLIENKRFVQINYITFVSQIRQEDVMVPLIKEFFLDFFLLKIALVKSILH